MATAVHAGHELRPEIAEAMVLDEAERFREEDPFTDRLAAVVPDHVVTRRSRFEADLNRPRREAIYRKPDGTNSWDYRIAAIYDTDNKAFDTESVMVHYEYINENRPDGAFSKDQVGWYIAQLDDPQRAPDVAKQIDGMFANSTSETKTSSEKAFMESFTGLFGNIGKIVTYVVSGVFFSMLLVTASTMAQAVRERTAELAVLKALGFGERLVFGLVLGEALAITLLGAALGLGGGWLLCKGLALGLTRVFPAFELRPEAVVVGAFAALVLGLVSGLWPAWRAMRMRMIDALREA